MGADAGPGTQHCLAEEDWSRLSHDCDLINSEDSLSTTVGCALVNPANEIPSLLYVGDTTAEL